MFCFYSTTVEREHVLGATSICSGVFSKSSMFSSVASDTFPFPVCLLCTCFYSVLLLFSLY